MGRKIFLIIIVLILVILSIGANAWGDSVKNQEIEIFNQVKDLGFSRVYVDIDDETSLLQIDINEGDFIKNITNFFVLMKRNYNSTSYVVELYDISSKIYQISTEGEKIDLYINAEISENQFLDLLEYTDARTIEERLKTDIEVLDYLVYGISIDEKKAEVDLIYIGENENNIISDLPNIHMLVIQYAPYVENTKINLENHVKDEFLEFEIKTDKLLSLLKEEITQESYYESIEISLEEEKSFLDIEKELGKLDFAFIGVLVIFALIGTYMGFIRSLFTILSYILGLAGAYFISPVVVKFLENIDGVVSFIHDRLYSSNIDRSILNLNISSINNLRGSNPVLDGLIKENEAILSGNTTVIEMLTNLVLSGIVIFIIFIILKIIIKKIGKSLHKNIKGEMSKKINRLLGFLVGLLIGVFNVVVFVIISSPFISMTSSTNIIGLFNNSFFFEKVVNLIF
ncbi:MAG: CvpA family protein [Eubacteriales bacterium]